MGQTPVKKGPIAVAIGLTATFLSAGTALARVDRIPPLQPTNFHVTSTTASSVAAAWAPSRDNVGAVGYRLFRDGSATGTSITSSYTFRGLGCSQTHTVGVAAYDAAGHTSATATLTATTSACTVTVDRSEPTTKASLAVGASHNAQSLDQSGNPAAVAHGKALLASVTTFQNQYIYGWGGANPEPSPGVYDWSTLDQRVNLMRSMGATPVLTLCCAPDWMTRLATTTSTYPSIPPTPSHYADFANLTRKIALRYPDVKYFDVWNQMKGFWSITSNNWDFVAYTNMYNAVYDALKGANHSARVGGPYLIIEDTGNPITSANMQVINYWLSYKHGADFISFTHAIVNWDVTTVPPLAAILASTGQAETIEMQVDAITSLPIWWAESYFDAKYNRITYADDQFQAVALASILYHEESGGASVDLRFHPEGDRTLPYGGNQESLYSDTSVAGGGAAFPNYWVYLIFHDDFPAGTQLYATSSSSTDIEVLASAAHTLLINKRPRKVVVMLNGTAITLGSYQVETR